IREAEPSIFVRPEQAGVDGDPLAEHQRFHGILRVGSTAELTRALPVRATRFEERSALCAASAGDAHGSGRAAALVAGLFGFADADAPLLDAAEAAVAGGSVLAALLSLFAAKLT